MWKKVLVAQSCPTLCNPKDCRLPGSVDGILQARILEWAAIPFSRGFSQPRDQTWVSCITGRFFIVWATRDDPFKLTKKKKKFGNSSYLIRISTKWIGKEMHGRRNSSLIHTELQTAFVWDLDKSSGWPSWSLVICPSLLLFTTRYFAHFQWYLM